MTCPVCFKEYPNDVTKCEVCGFTYERGINPIHLTPEEGKIWFDTVVKPYREKWHEQLKALQGLHTQTKEKAASKTIPVKQKEIIHKKIFQCRCQVS